jgi:hypothetical protein
MITDLLHHIAIAGTMVYQKADLWHPAFIPSGVMNSDVREATETDEDVLINARDAPRLVPDEVLERAPPAWEVITEYVDSEKWCGEERTKYAVVKVEATSFVLAVICVALALVLVGIMFPDGWALIGP